MSRKPKRDLTMEEQLARGPVDLPFLMLTLILLGIGLIVVFSASYATAYYDPDVSSPLFYFQRQALFAGAGLAVMYLVSKINYQTLRILSLPMLVVSVALLALALTPLGVEINQVKRWLRIFIVAGPTYQPSEIAKVTVILFFTGRTLNRLDRIGFLELVPYGAVLVIVLLLVVLEPHMSGTILIMVGAASVLFAAGIHLGWFIGLGSVAVAGLAFIILATDYMTRKINLWLNPWDYPLDGGYQIIQSLYAIGSGGLLGKGLGKSLQKFDFLPEPENDMIFSIAVEELGFVGAVIILVLFALLILRGYWLALHARDKFGTLTVVGIITLLAVQVFLNVGVVTNLIPNTGISLPFFSYGGTALMIHLAEMGIVLSVSRQCPAPKKD